MHLDVLSRFGSPLGLSGPSLPEERCNMTQEEMEDHKLRCALVRQPSKGDLLLSQRTMEDRASCVERGLLASWVRGAALGRHLVLVMRVLMPGCWGPPRIMLLRARPTAKSAPTWQKMALGDLRGGRLSCVGWGRYELRRHHSGELIATFRPEPPSSDGFALTPRSRWPEPRRLVLPILQGGEFRSKHLLQILWCAATDRWDAAVYLLQLSVSISFRWICEPGQPGDWSCPKCRAVCFARNPVCGRCNCPKPESIEEYNLLAAAAVGAIPGVKASVKGYVPPTAELKTDATSPWARQWAAGPAGGMFVGETNLPAWLRGSPPEEKKNSSSSSGSGQAKKKQKTGEAKAAPKKKVVKIKKKYSGLSKEEVVKKKAEEEEEKRQQMRERRKGRVISPFLHWIPQYLCQVTCDRLDVSLDARYFLQRLKMSLDRLRELERHFWGPWRRTRAPVLGQVCEARWGPIPACPPEVMREAARIATTKASALNLGSRLLRLGSTDSAGSDASTSAWSACDSSDSELEVHAMVVSGSPCSDGNLRPFVPMSISGAPCNTGCAQFRCVEREGARGGVAAAASLVERPQTANSQQFAPAL
eukprot:s3759_g1.t1